jgi:hypothetical protein
MTHQTALDWLMDQLDDKDVIHPLLLWKAKVMEKEQMKDAVLAQSTSHTGLRKIFDNQFEQYYNDTFVGD